MIDPHQGWAHHNHDRFLDLLKQHPATMQRYPRSWCSWTDREDQALTDEHQAGRTVQMLALLHQRKPTAILSRLIKLELVEDLTPERTRQPEALPRAPQPAASPQRVDGHDHGLLVQQHLGCPGCGEDLRLRQLTADVRSRGYECQACGDRWRRRTNHRCPKCTTAAELIADTVHQHAAHNPFESYEHDGSYITFDVVKARCPNCNITWMPQPPPAPDRDKPLPERWTHRADDWDRIIERLVQLVEQHGPMTGWELYAEYADRAGLEDETQIRADLNKAAYRATQQGALVATNPTGAAGQIVQTYSAPP